jgi:hypothetical protein
LEFGIVHCPVDGLEQVSGSDNFFWMSAHDSGMAGSIARYDKPQIPSNGTKRFKFCI